MLCVAVGCHPTVSAVTLTLTHTPTYPPPQVTKEQYKEMIERRRAELPPPPPRPVNTAAPAPAAASEGASEEGEAPQPKLSPKERMDANW